VENSSSLYNVVYFGGSEMIDVLRTLRVQVRNSSTFFCLHFSPGQRAGLPRR
jgi:hypothetical protein